MKNKLLLPALWVIALGSMNLVGQTTPVLHEARFKVYDFSNKAPIAYAGVYDKADKQLGQTDLKGTVVLQLPASKTDVYSIKYPGFSNMNIRLTHADQKAADYEVFLQPKDAGQPSTETGSAKPSMESGDTELVKVYVKQEPAAYKKAKPAQPGAVEFAVQLSATSRPITDKHSLKSWEEIGPVFIHTENGLYKVRIGPYDTQEDAKAVLLAVKARGKKDAFIVVQKGFENQKPFEPRAHEDKIEPDVRPESAMTATTPAMETGGEYKVRLASYLHPGGFNTKDIDQYGKLESYRKGDWTIMLIGGLKNMEDARRVRDAVIAKGYKDATIVIDRDGLLEELR